MYLSLTLLNSKRANIFDDYFHLYAMSMRVVQLAIAERPIVMAASAMSAKSFKGHEIEFVLWSQTKTWFH